MMRQQHTLFSNYAIILLCFIFFRNSLFAQDATVVRMEVPSDLESNAFHLVPMEKEGLMIFYESNEVNEQGLRKWYFGLFNTLLKQEWIKYVPLTDQLEYVDSRQVGKHVYFCFKNSDKGKATSGFYEIVNYDMRTNDFSKISGSLPLLATIAGFEVIETTACLALNLKKDETDLLFINVNSGDIKPIHVKEGSQNYFESLQVDYKNKQVYAIVKFMGNNNLQDEIIKFSLNGEKISSYLVQSTDAIKMLRNFRIDPLSKDKLVAFGTYDINTSRSLSFKDINENEDTKSAGFFYLSFNKEVQESLQFYDFMSFNNIYGSLQGRKIVTNKNSNYVEDNVPGKNVSAYYNLCDPQLFRYKDQYIVTVEAYKYFYRTETRMEYDFYGTPMPYTYKVFDGYEFYDMIIASFSEDGKVVWNNDFALKNLKSNYLTRNTIAFIDGNLITMAYVNDGKIVAQTIDGPDDIDSYEVPIATNIQRDKVSADENTYIVHWYDDFFLVYGNQQINNRSLLDQNIRTVFFANKVAFQ